MKSRVDTNVLTLLVIPLVKSYILNKHIIRKKKEMQIELKLYTILLNTIIKTREKYRSPNKYYNFAFCESDTK